MPIVSRSIAIIACAVAALAPLHGQEGSAVPRTPPPPQVAAEDYTISRQDVLSIIVIDQPALTQKYTVEADGTLNFPLVGRVVAAGKTLRQVERELKRLLIDGQFFKNPQVAVSLDQFKGRRIWVGGNVGSPGMYPLGEGLTLVEALTKAGGATASEAIIIRSKGAKSPLMPDNPGDAEVKRVNLREFEKEIEQGNLSRNEYLQDGDTVFVPRVDRNRIWVTGQVKLPNAYSVPEGTTVLQAIALAGGLTDAAGKIEIFRIVKNRKQTIKAKLEDVVQPGDTIMVRERLF